MRHHQCWDNKRLKRHNTGIIRKKEPEVLALAETGDKNLTTVLTLNSFGKRCMVYVHIVNKANNKVRLYCLRNKYSSEKESN